MMRGGNRQMRRMMDKMGLDMTEIPNVQEVIIKTDKKEIIIPKPSVTEMKSKENSIFQVIAESFEDGIIFASKRMSVSKSDWLSRGRLLGMLKQKSISDFF